MWWVECVNTKIKLLLKRIIRIIKIWEINKRKFERIIGTNQIIIKIRIWLIEISN